MEKFKRIKIASILGMIGNLFLFFIKIIVALYTNSQAMFVDALNSITDVVTSAVTLIGSHISSKPKDDDHNLGYGKAEYIFSMLISIAMFALTVKLIYNSFKTLIVRAPCLFSLWLIVVCLVTIFIKFFLYRYTIKISKKYDNLLIKSNAIDHRNDCVLTSVNLLSVILTYFGITSMDAIACLLISTWIFASAINIFKVSYNVLMDKAIPEEIKAKVIGIATQNGQVLKIDHFNSTPIGYRYQISFTIYVDGSLSTYASHHIADEIERKIESSVEEVYLTVIHVNPSL